jgi:hypothetical protein
MTEPTATSIAGQLSYLFEDQPELREATDADLAARLDHEDRAARARANNPYDSAAEIEARAKDLPVHVTAALVHEARAIAYPAAD